MKISSLNLRNYRCFPKLQIPISFDKSMTVLAATNGRGKSSILDAITVALSPFSSQFPLGDKKGFRSPDAYLKALPNTLNTESSYPIVIETEFNVQGEIINITRDKSNENGRTTLKQAAKLQQYAKRLSDDIRLDDRANQTILPVISYYGTGRLHAQKKLMQQKSRTDISSPQSRTAGYLNCLSAESTYKHFDDWMKVTTLGQLQESDPSYEVGRAETYSDMLAGVREAVQHLLEEQQWSDLRYTVKNTELTVREKDMRIPLASLSDGLRSVIAMVGDLAYRCITLNPQLGGQAPRETPGIVLIDEIEMHLHPSWQQKILGQLTEAFPNVQFICTTHSPQVLTTVRPECIRTIGEDGRILSPSCKTYGAESKRVLEELMNVDSRPHVLDTEIREFITLTDGGDWNSKEYHELRALLLRELGESDPLIIDAEIRQQFQRLEAE